MRACVRACVRACMCACCQVCLVENYLRDGLNKAKAIIRSLDLGEAVREVIPVVFSLAEKGCLFFLVKLVDENIQNADLACQILSCIECCTFLAVLTSFAFFWCIACITTSPMRAVGPHKLKFSFLLKISLASSPLKAFSKI